MNFFQLRFSPSHKAAILNNQFQQHQSLLSPINTGIFSPKSVDQQLPGHPSLLQASFGVPSSGRMSPRSLDVGSPLNSRLAAFAQREKQQQNLRSLSSRDLGGSMPAIAGSPVSPSWSKWSSPSRTIDWGVNGEELGHLRRSSSFELRPGGEEPDVSWVHSLVKESPPEKMMAPATSVGSTGLSSPLPGASDGSNSQIEALGAWLEQMQLDQMVA